MKKLALLFVFVSGAAYAGGLERPNQISARGVGMGGAFAGVADDPTAWYFNPAGATWSDDAVSIGGEFVYAPRTYTPIDSTGARGADQNATAAAPVPSLGVVLHPRTDGVPSRLAFGAGFWNNYGGQIKFPSINSATPVSAINSSTDLVLELAAGVSYEVDDVLAIGGDVRMGLGLFSVNSTIHPATADLSTLGIGVGANLGVMLRPTPKLQLGLTWRSPMTIDTQGSGTASIQSPMQAVDAKHTQHWPQQVAFGASVWAAPKLRVAAELDWTQWSAFRDITIEVTTPDGGTTPQTIDTSWHDNYSARGGFEYLLSGGAVRAGAYYDTNAIPNRTIERQYLDSNKIGLSAGGSALFGAWRLDGALDFTLPGTRTVRDNTGDYMFGSNSWPITNIAPGDYKGYVVTFELALVRRL